MSGSNSESNALRVSRHQIGELAVDIWKIHRRATRTGAESIILACDRAIERLEEMGLNFTEMVGDEYNQHMRANVVKHEGGTVNQRIVECFCPAVYYTNPEDGITELIRRAEIAVQGDEV